MSLLYATLGLIFGGFLTWLFFVFKRKQVVKAEANVVMSTLKKVSKLVTVEGEFSEIYKHSEKQPILFNLFKTEKKAIIILKAKVLMGYDLAKMEFTVSETQRKIHIKQKPKPEILNLWTDAEYYDIKHGTFTRFSEEDLNKIKVDATQFLIDKIKESDLPRLTSEQGNIGLSLLEDTTKSLGWELKY